MRLGQIEFDNVSKQYAGEAALQEISFKIDRSEHTAIVGPSGCGKSTTLRLLAGLERPSSGRIFVDGEPVSEAGKILKSPYERDIGMVFQDLGLWPNLSVFSNVYLGLSGLNLSKAKRADRTFQTLALCGIEELADRKPATLSGGQQQRAALARAIAPQPRFLLLDEPFAGLDLVIRAKLLGEISRLAEKKDLTIILVSHNPLDAIGLCRSAVVLVRGQIQEYGRLNDLLEQPRSDILKVFRNHLSKYGSGYERRQGNDEDERK